MSGYDFNEIFTELKSKNPHQRIHSIGKIIKYQESNVVNLLVEIAIDDDNYEVRYKAENAIKKLSKLPKVVNLLIARLIETSSIEQKVLVAKILSEFGDSSAVEPIVKISLDYPDNLRLRESAVWILLRYDRVRAKDYCNQAKINILVADDEEDVCDLICFTLMFAGYAIIRAHNGNDAYEFVKICRPDLALLDVRMPRMTGYEVCRKIKETEVINRTPVVFLSAKGQESEIRDGLDAGAEEYLLKPFAPDQLTAAIKAVMRKFRLGIYDDPK
jgi:CheY-like chemotaxis protein